MENSRRQVPGESLSGAFMLGAAANAVHRMAMSAIPMGA